MTMTARAPRWPATLVAAVVLAMVATLVPALPSPAHADSGMESEFVSLINKERSAQGRSSVRVAGDLTSVARSHSKVMADQSNLHHNPNLGSDVSGWKKVGENVGRGPSVGSIHKAFMNSSGHKRNILDADWVEVGVGVVVRDGQIWVTEVFRLPAGAAPAPEKKSEPEPEKKSEPEPEKKSEPTSAPKNDPAPAPSNDPAPAADPAPTPEPDPEPHEVIDQPLPLDRVTLKMARLEAAEGSMSLDEVLGS